MYENGKMRPVETILRMRGRGIKENEGGMNLAKIDFKNFCKCHSILQYNNMIINLKQISLHSCKTMRSKKRIKLKILFLVSEIKNTN
jgi:hypothetical protein